MLHFTQVNWLFIVLLTSRVIEMRFQFQRGWILDFYIWTFLAGVVFNLPAISYDKWCVQLEWAISWMESQNYNHPLKCFKEIQSDIWPKKSINAWEITSMDPTITVLFNSYDADMRHSYISCSMCIKSIMQAQTVPLSYCHLM